MRHFTIISFLIATLLGAIIRAESVPATLVSLSPRIFPAIDRDGFSRLDYKMSISAFNNPNNINDELSLATSDHGFSHQGFFLMEDPILVETFPVIFVLDVPPFADANTNGVYDFFDPEAAVENERTEGLHSDGDDGAVGFFATWNRAAGQSTGTVLIELPFLGREFTHQMSLFHYDGRFDFTREGTNLNGAISLTNVANLDERISGPFLAKVAATNSISYEAGSWVGAGDFAYRFSATDTLDQADASFVTILRFDDGYPATIESDYLDWLLIVRSEDKNANGILDLAEAASQATPARLAVAKTTEGIRVTIFASPGTRWILQSSDTVHPTAWTEAGLVTVTGTEAGISLPNLKTAQFLRAVQQ